jgi:hypothetical protein
VDVGPKNLALIVRTWPRRGERWPSRKRNAGPRSKRRRSHGPISERTQPQRTLTHAPVFGLRSTRVRRWLHPAVRQGFCLNFGSYPPCAAPSVPACQRPVSVAAGTNPRLCGTCQRNLAARETESGDWHQKECEALREAYPVASLAQLSASAHRPPGILRLVFLSTGTWRRKLPSCSRDVPPPPAATLLFSISVGREF